MKLSNFNKPYTYNLIGGFTSHPSFVTTRRNRRKRLKLSISTLTRLIGGGRQRSKLRPDDFNAQALHATNLKLLSRLRDQLAQI